MRKDLFT
jgi:hypothetical protein